MIARPGPRPPTRRQRQVLELLSWGWTKRDVARYLGHHYQTVVDVMLDLMDRWGVATTAQCVELGLEYRLIRHPHLIRS